MYMAKLTQNTSVIKLVIGQEEGHDLDLIFGQQKLGLRYKSCETIR